MCRTTIIASPFSYSKARDTSRPRIGQCATVRAGLGGKSFVHFHILRAMPNGLVRQHFPEGRPACIKYGLRQAGLGESTSVDIANGDVIEGSGNFDRSLVQEVRPASSRARMDCFDPSSLMSPLRDCQRRFCFSVKPWSRNPFAVRQHGKIFQAKIDANATIDRTQRQGSDLDHDIQEPVATSIAGKASSVLNLALRQRARVKHAEGIACETKRIAFTMQIASFQRNPPQGFATPIAQERATVLGTRFGKLFAGGIDAAGMQPQFLAATRRQSVQIKSGKPRPVKAQSIFLPVVAIIPDEVHRTAPLTG